MPVLMLFSRKLTVFLEDLDIAQCEECGKLFRLVPGRKCCSACMQEMGLAPPVVQEAPFEHSRQETEEEPSGPPCVRCRLRPIVEDTEFCLYCHIDLYSSLGEAASGLFQRVEVIEEAKDMAPNIMATLEDKRARTATSRINVVGARRLK